MSDDLEAKEQARLEASLKNRGGAAKALARQRSQEASRDAERQRQKEAELAAKKGAALSPRVQLSAEEEEALAQRQRVLDEQRAKEAAEAEEFERKFGIKHSEDATPKGAALDDEFVIKGNETAEQRAARLEKERSEQEAIEAKFATAGGRASSSAAEEKGAAMDDEFVIKGNETAEQRAARLEKEREAAAALDARYSSATTSTIEAGVDSTSHAPAADDAAADAVDTDAEAEKMMAKLGMVSPRSNAAPKKSSSSSSSHFGTDEKSKADKEQERMMKMFGGGIKTQLK